MKLGLSCLSLWTKSPSTWSRAKRDLWRCLNSWPSTETRWHQSRFWSDSGELGAFRRSLYSARPGCSWKLDWKSVLHTSNSPRLNQCFSCCYYLIVLRGQCLSQSEQIYRSNILSSSDLSRLHPKAKWMYDRCQVVCHPGARWCFSYHCTRYQCRHLGSTDRRILKWLLHCSRLLSFQGQWRLQTHPIGLQCTAILVSFENKAPGSRLIPQVNSLSWIHLPQNWFHRRDLLSRWRLHSLATWSAVLCKWLSAWLHQTQRNPECQYR